MNHPRYAVEQASPEDAERIARFQAAMALETEEMALEEATVRAGVLRLFQEPQRGFYLVARGADGRAVGCLLLLKEWSDWRNGDIWWMHSVFVEPLHRGRGVFRRMFQVAESLARSAGVRGIRLYVERGNHRAQRVYRRLGMDNDHYELFEKML